MPNFSTLNQRLKAKFTMLIGIVVVITGTGIVPETYSSTGVTYDQKRIEQEMTQKKESYFNELADNWKLGKGGVTDYIAKFNANVNDLFNEKIKKFVIGVKKSAESGKDYNYHFPPAKDAECFSNSSKNSSVYCLSLLVELEYQAYKEVLKNLLDENAAPSDWGWASKTFTKISESSMEGRWPFGAKVGFFGLTPSKDTVNNNLENINKYRNEATTLINEELISSYKRIELALETYREFQSALMIHYEFAKKGGVIDSLEDYRDSLGPGKISEGEVGGIRTLVEKLPTKFHDASTTKCK